MHNYEVIVCLEALSLSQQLETIKWSNNDFDPFQVYQTFLSLNRVDTDKVFTVVTFSPLTFKLLRDIV